MIPDFIESLSTEDIRMEITKLDNQLRILRSDEGVMEHEQRKMQKKVEENKQKVKVNTQLPYLVGNIVEVRCLCPSSFPSFLLSSLSQRTRARAHTHTDPGR